MLKAPYLAELVDSPAYKFKQPGDFVLFITAIFIDTLFIFRLLLFFISLTTLVLLSSTMYVF